MQARPFVALLVAVVCLAALAESKRHGHHPHHDRVHSLPGIGKLPTKVFSGYEAVDINYGSYMYYYFVESQDDPEKDPVIVWLNGGPGCSSLIGTFIENGPFLLTHAEVFVENEYAFNRNASILYIDNPVGAGFSYTHDRSGVERNESIIARNILRLMDRFFDHHHKYRDNDIYLMGEDYAAKFVLYTATHILSHNLSHVFHLRGIGLGNGWVAPVQQLCSNADYLLKEGFINHHTASVYNHACLGVEKLFKQDRYEEAAMAGALLTSLLEKQAGITVPTNIYAKEDPVAPRIAALRRYLNRDDVREALHVPAHMTWRSCSAIANLALIGDAYKDVQVLLPYVINRVGKAVLWNGKNDLVCNYEGTTRWLHSVAWKNHAAFVGEKYHPILTHDREVGYYKTAYGLTHAVVNDAGLMSATDQPRVVFELVQRLLRSNETSDMDAAPDSQVDTNSDSDRDMHAEEDDRYAVIMAQLFGSQHKH